MMIPLTLLIGLVGMVLNLSFSGRLLQPDWALAFFLAALLSRRAHWLWVAPAVWGHDLVFYWTSFANLPWILLTPVIMAWSDAQIGPSLIPRVASMLMVVLSLLWWGWSFQACVLTLLLCLGLWYMMVRLHVQSA